MWKAGNYHIKEGQFTKDFRSNPRGLTYTCEGCRIFLVLLVVNSEVEWQPMALLRLP